MVLGLVASGCGDPGAGGGSSSTGAVDEGSTTLAHDGTGHGPGTGPTATGGSSGDPGLDDTGSGDASSTGGPPHMVSPCDALPAAGTWEHITPLEVDLGEAFQTPAGENYGVHSFVIDPQDTARVWLGTSAQGIFVTDDCGASWTHVDTGTNAEVMDGGRQWTFVIDPSDPDILYTNTGYGALGAWKSTNGGVDWNPLVDAPWLSALQFGGFVQFIRMDPTDPQHLLVTPHFECEVGVVDGQPTDTACMLETMDAGATWRILEGTPPAGESASQKMIDGSTWFWAEGFGGLWRTVDGGASWQHVYDEGYATATIVPAADGSWLTGGVFSILRSTDEGASWAAIPDSPGSDVLTGDDELLFSSRNGFYARAAADDPTTWTAMPTPTFPSPEYVVTWDLRYDPDHRILYSLNSRNGFWRIVVD